MTNIFLVRHGLSEVTNYISGRMPGIHLSKRGKEMVEELSKYFKDITIHKIFSSPIERTFETAHILAHNLDMKVEIKKGLIEMDFGDWTGKKFDELRKDEEWNLFFNKRGSIRIPGGELLLEVQLRMVKTVEETLKTSSDKNIIFVSHGDPIKSLICYYLGIPLDFVNRLQIDMASVSLLRFTDYKPKVILTNFTGLLTQFFL